MRARAWVLIAMAVVVSSFVVLPTGARAAPSETPDLDVTTSVSYGSCAPPPPSPMICSAKARPEDPITLRASFGWGLQHGRPTGTVTFSVDGNPVATKELIDGRASAGPFHLPVGDHEIGATYSGDENYVGTAATAYPRFTVYRGEGAQPVQVVTRTPEIDGYALVNLTSTSQLRPGGRTNGGFVSTGSCSRMDFGPVEISNLNFANGQDIANLALVDRSNDVLCFRTSYLTNVLVDVQGVFSSLPGGLGLVPMEPQRVLDTRGGLNAGPTAITRVETGAPPGTEAVLVNLTMTMPAADGFITADRCSQTVLGDVGRSNGNFELGRDMANLNVVPVDGDGAFCITASAPVHLLADVQGAFTPTGALRMAGGNARRLVDTRTTARLEPGGRLRVETGAPAGTTAVAVNVTMTDAIASGFVTADRCSRLVAGDVGRSNGNFPVGHSIANLNLVAIDADGAFCITASAPVHLVIDLQSNFREDAGYRLHLVPPMRVFDGRNY